MDRRSSATRYRYQRKAEDYGGLVDRFLAGASATSYHRNRNLENGKSYEFQVRAVNAVLVRDSRPRPVATLAEAAPGAPVNLTATVGDGQVVLSWGAPADGGSEILRYEYRYARSGVAYDDALVDRQRRRECQERHAVRI